MVSFAPTHPGPDACACGHWRDMEFLCAHARAVMAAAEIDMKSRTNGSMGQLGNRTNGRLMWSLLIASLLETDILSPLHVTRKRAPRK